MLAHTLSYLIRDKWKTFWLKHRGFHKIANTVTTTPVCSVSPRSFIKYLRRSGHNRKLKIYNLM